MTRARVRIDVRDCLEHFLTWVLGRPGLEPSARLAGLEASLDELALAARDASSTPPDPHLGEGTGEEGAELRETLGGLFPDLGLYQAAGLDPTESPTVGDALDDLTDIVLEVRNALSAWTDVGEEAGRAALAWSYRIHWGEHLRGLAWYLHELSRE